MYAGSEYRTSNLAIRYPFSSDALALAQSQDDWSVTDPTMFPLDAIVDASITFPARFEHEAVYLASVIHLGTDYWFNFVDQGGQLVSTLLVELGTEQFTLNEAYADGKFIQIVFNTAVVAEWLALIPAAPASVLFDQRLPLEHHAVHQMPTGVLTFDIYNDGRPDMPEVNIPGPYSGDVLFKAGYNVFLVDTDQDDETDVHEITLNAEPGTGLGQEPCPNIVVGSESASRLVPDSNGNINLLGDDCYGIQNFRTDGVIRIDGGCFACCDCDDFTEAARLIKLADERVRDAYDDLIAARSSYVEGVNIFTDDIIPGYSGMRLSVSGNKGSGYYDPADPGGGGGVAECAVGRGGDINSEFTVNIRNLECEPLTYSVSASASGTITNAVVTYVDTDKETITKVLSAGGGSINDGNTIGPGETAKYRLKVVKPGGGSSSLTATANGAVPSGSTFNASDSVTV